MKIINLDKFSNRAEVTLDGKTYQVRGMTVDMYLNDPDFNGLNEVAPDQKSQVEAMLTILGKLTTVPADVLSKQDFNTLAALMTVAQGNDPGKVDEGTSKPGNE